MSSTQFVLSAGRWIQIDRNVPESHSPARVGIVPPGTDGPLKPPAVANSMDN